MNHLARATALLHEAEGKVLTQEELMDLMFALFREIIADAQDYSKCQHGNPHNKCPRCPEPDLRWMC